MNFPGTCKLVLSDAALMAAIEGSLNAPRDGEDYIYVTEVSREGYGYGDWKLTITTDAPTAAVVSTTNAEQVAA
jgi:hypothetical protein